MPLFSERLKGLMIEADVKSEQLGGAVGISGSAIRRWLRGSGTINLANLVSIADYFCCSIDYLAGISENDPAVVSKNIPKFSVQLRKVLKEKGLSRYALNKNTKFKDKYFYKWDKGSMPTLPSLIELANILDCTLDHLVGREN